jgi:oxygen-independent coproporphyrinogen-3 oxidase
VLIPEDSLPDPVMRYALFRTAQQRLLEQGYVQIGIDHFALPHDGLAKALDTRTLRRSFQGYTDDRIPHLIALGASAISTYPEGFAQNHAPTSLYSAAIDAGMPATTRGYRLSDRDRSVAAFVESLMCYHDADLPLDVPGLRDRADGVLADFPEAVSLRGNRLTLADWARPLVRIIAARIADTNSPPSAQYSQAI